MSIDEYRTIPPNIILDFAKQGLFGLLLDSKYEGLNYSLNTFGEIIELLSSIDLNLAVLVSGHNITANLIQSDASKEHHSLLKELALGQSLVGFSLTELHAGSNPRNIECFIEEVAGDYYLTGNKYYSGLAAWATYSVVFAKLKQANEIKYCGLLVPMNSPGVNILDETNTLGLKGIVQNSVRYDRVKLKPESLLAKPEANLGLAQQAMYLARLTIGYMSLGAMKRLTQIMINFASKRKVSTGKLLDNPAARGFINHAIIKTYIIDQLIKVIHRIKDNENTIPEDLIIILKNAAAEFAYETADSAIQLLGGRGYEENNIVSRIMRDVRAFRIFEGPTETLNLHLGASVFNNADRLEQIMRKYLDAEEICHEFLLKIKEIKKKLKDYSHQSDNNEIENWLFLITAKITAYIFLLALLHKGKQSSDPLQQMAYIYIQQQYDNVCQNYLGKFHDNLLVVSKLDYAQYAEGIFNALGDYQKVNYNICRTLDDYLVTTQENKLVTDIVPLDEYFLAGETILIPAEQLNVLNSIDQIISQYATHIAVEHGVESLTFAELNDLSEKVITVLSSYSLKKGEKILLYLEKSINLIAAILACLRLGITFVVLTPMKYLKRHEDIIYKVKPAIIIAEEIMDSSGANIPVLLLSTALKSITTKDVNYNKDKPDAADIAYIVFTSGSTGIPKGIQVSHDAACHFIQAAKKSYHINSSSKLYLFVALDFDVAIGEILVALTTGATLCLPKNRLLAPDQNVINELKEYRATHMQISASALAVLPYANLPDLQYLIAGGEQCPLDIVRRWAKNRYFYNAYGPAEAVILSTVYEYQRNETELLPIGRPVANKKLYVLDEHMLPVHKGTVGELYIGRNLSSGYLDAIDLTKKKFVNNPFVDKELLYKTGDLVKLNQNDQLEFVGRSDYQLKINGVRIEPEEIEKAFAEYPGIDGVIVTIDDNVQTKQLIAYLLLNAKIKIQNLRQFLEEKLPVYMIPSKFYHTDKFELTLNGKIDRRALPEKTKCRLLVEVESAINEEELTEVQKIIITFWQKAIQYRPTDLDTNFFHVGGDSLSLVKLCTYMNEAFSVDISLDMLYTNNTVRKQALLVPQEDVVYII